MTIKEIRSMNPANMRKISMEEPTEQLIEEIGQAALQYGTDYSG
jgi:hypothetical protein